MPDRDGVDDLRGHIDAAHAAAEELVREAEARARDAAEDVPPRGWEAPRADTEKGSLVPELHVVLALLEAARHAMPAELTRQLAQAVRELLLAVRALIDWYVDRLEHPPAPEPEVEDIPID